MTHQSVTISKPTGSAAFQDVQQLLQHRRRALVALALAAIAALPLIWLVAVALLSGGVVGVVLRWPELAWFSDTRPRWRAIRVGATLVSCTLIITVAVI